MAVNPTDRLNTLITPSEVYTVAQLNREVRLLLNSNFPLIWVEGELSNLTRPASGHLYFTLKDEQAQVRCAMFKNRNRVLKFKPENGSHVLAWARVDLYERRGDFQLTVERLEAVGYGALQYAFDALKQKLAAEGLFDITRKKPLPAFPRQLGLITSPTGAVIHDMLSVLQRRFPIIPVVVYPVPVQGENAATAIVQALFEANRRQDCDTLIVARGGGSMEDLWAFNEEIVARAIAASDIPIISGVGHDIDFTIADFVADARAPTPSVATEMASPDQQELLSILNRQDQRLRKHIHSTTDNLQQRLRWLQGRLEQQHPRNRLQQQNQRVDELERILRQAMILKIKSLIGHVQALSNQLHRHSPAVPLAKVRATYCQLHERLLAAIQGQIKNRVHRLATLTQTLQALSPLATLSRGYAIVTRKQDGAIVRTGNEVDTGDHVNLQFEKAHLSAEITEDN